MSHRTISKPKLTNVDPSKDLSPAQIETRKGILNYQRLYASAVSGFFSVLAVSVFAFLDPIDHKSKSANWLDELLIVSLLLVVISIIEVLSSFFTKIRVKKHGYRYEDLQLLDDILPTPRIKPKSKLGSKM
jgi:hypothetical protein